MTLIDRFLAEHPFFCSLFEYERRIIAHYIELYRCPKNSYLVLPNELQEVLWIVVRGRLAEYETISSDSENSLRKASSEHSEGTEPQHDGQTPSNLKTGQALEQIQAQSAPTVQNTSPIYSQATPQVFQPQLDTKQQSLESTVPRTDSSELSQSKHMQHHLLRYFLPGDLINVHALTQALIAKNEIISLEDDTQVICMTAFHLAKLAQQQPKIHRALRPVYNREGFLISGLPQPVWQQMDEVPPPHTRDFGKLWLQRKPLMHSYKSWLPSICAFMIFGLGNIWQFQNLHWNRIPFLNIILAFASLLFLIIIIMQRYRSEFTLNRSLLHVTERSLLGLSSKIKSYPMLSIREVSLLPIPIITPLLRFGGLRITTYRNETFQLFPLDQVLKWQDTFGNSLQDARLLQEQIQHSETIKQFQKWHKLQPELIKEINYRNAELEGILHRSNQALLIQIIPPLLPLVIGFYYSLQSELWKIYLTIPLLSLSLIITYQILRWMRYSWRISQEYLFRNDNYWGHRYNLKIPIQEIQDLHLKHLNFLGYGSISVTVNGQVIHLQNLKNPQNILDEIEALRHSVPTNDVLTYKQLGIYHDFNYEYSPEK